MTDRCALHCNVKDRNGKVVPSILWNDLHKLFGKDRRQTVAHYFLTKDNNFLMKNSGHLEFDVNGEVTIDSLKKVLDEDGEYNNISNALVLAQLNREIKAGSCPYSVALDNVLTFNKSNKFREGFMATLSPKEDGSYAVSVIERNPQAEAELANHVKNKILTDAVATLLRDRGFNISFLDNSKYKSFYSTDSNMTPIDGLYTVASVLNGVNSSKEAAEVAGHFIVSAMRDSPLVQRLVNVLTPEVQKELFKSRKSPLFRDDFVVTNISSMEAAGILIGKQLLDGMDEKKNAFLWKAGKVLGFAPKQVFKLLRNIVQWFGKKLLGIKPDNIKSLIDRVSGMASTAANGFINDPDSANLDDVLKFPDTYVTYSARNDLSEASKRNVAYFNKALSGLKAAAEDLKTLIRSSTGDAKEMYGSFKSLSDIIQTDFGRQLSIEAFAKNASVSGIVSLLSGMADILDTDVRKMLDSIQPSDKSGSYNNIVNNARNMRAVNNTVKNIASVYSLVFNNLDDIVAPEKVSINDMNGNIVEVSLKEAVDKLGDILFGNKEAYINPDNKETDVRGLMGLLEVKRKQVFVDAMESFYGADYVNMSAGIVWKHRGAMPKLTAVPDRRVLVSDFIDSLESDISWFDRYLRSAADCGDFVTAVGDKVTKTANKQADDIAFNYWNQLETLRKSMKDLFGSDDTSVFYETTVDENGRTVKTGNFISEVNYGAWESDRYKFKKELATDFYKYLSELKEQYYRKNKNTSIPFVLTDQQKGALWHTFVAPKWKQWHQKHSEKQRTTTGYRYVPAKSKYFSQQWEDMFGTGNPSLSSEEIDKRKEKLRWYRNLMGIKNNMDSLLPAGSTVSVRAPQLMGRFSHRFRALYKQYGGTGTKALANLMRNKSREWLSIKPEETYLFGSENEFNDINDDPLHSDIFFEREKIDRIPLYGINKLHDMNDLSTDLFGTLMSYGSMAASNFAMSQVNSIFELGKDVLKDRMFKGKPEKLNGSQSNAYHRYIKFVDKQVYGINVDVPNFDRKGLIMRFLNNLSSLGGRILLAGNIPGGIVNTGTGAIEILKEAMAGENFSISELRKANALYFSSTVQNWLGNVSFKEFKTTKYKQDKNTLWIRHWNILSENRRFLREHSYDMNNVNRLLHFAYGDFMMLPYKTGDHYMQTIPYYAMGYHTKVYDADGNEMSLIDAYDRVQDEDSGIWQLKLKEGIYKSPENILDHKITLGIINKINDIESANPNIKNKDAVFIDLSEDEKDFLRRNKLDVPVETDNNPVTYLRLVKLKEALRNKSQSLLYNAEDETEFMNKCRNICNRLHGIYNSEDKVAIQQNFYGNLVMSMRGYALGLVNRRFAGSSFNLPQGKVVEGSLNTGLKALLYSWRALTGDMNYWASAKAALLSGIIPSIATAGATAFMPSLLVPTILTGAYAGLMPLLMLNKRFNTKLLADMRNAGWSEHQFYNIRRCGADFLIINTLMLLKFLVSPKGVFGSDDDDDDSALTDNVAAGITYYFMMRWLREQAAFNSLRGAENEFSSLLDWAPVGLSGCKTMYDIFTLWCSTMLDQAAGGDKDNSDLYYTTSKEGVYEEGDEKWKIKMQRLIPYYRSFYTFRHPYDAAAGYEYGRRVKSN